MKLPTLYTERLMIRPLSVLDADDMYEYAKTPLVGPMAGWPPHTSLSDTINVIKIMYLHQDFSNILLSLLPFF